MIGYMNNYSGWTFWIGLAISVVVIALIVVAFVSTAWEGLRLWRRRRRLQRDRVHQEFKRQLLSRGDASRTRR